MSAITWNSATYSGGEGARGGGGRPGDFCSVHRWGKITGSHQVLRCRSASCLLEYPHMLGMVYRDLKPENVFV
ncbi:hypothetical protein PVAP13_7KG159900 [Panicum virgatum]|uniref:Protein kinase domain-containing protein n=1 Tax=Panicum virgatum TaxID=38727 RepID=A0A8T0QGA2_PANVG|nr:hypothetical protein PVAP13_7KG159900 [Panicum virgatum]